MQVVETWWYKPVTVRLQNGLEHTFHSAEDAVDFMENEWPKRFGRHHRRALDLCRAAQRRFVSRDAAREAFISACLEAGMPLVIGFANPQKGVSTLQPSNNPVAGLAAGLEL
jgi:hypothetical protein